MTSVTNKIRKQPSGKENGTQVQATAVGKEYVDLPSVPANRVRRPGSTASTGYDRYAEPYAQQQVWAA